MLGEIKERENIMNFKQINPEENDKFSQANLKGHIFQSSYWARVKSNWYPFYLGGYSDDKIVLTCVLLTRKIPLTNKSMGYIPRGFVCDYMNDELVKEFIGYLKKFCKEKNIAFVTMDPDITLSLNGERQADGEHISDVLKSTGLICSRSVNFEAIQARHVYRVKLLTNNSYEENCKNTFEKFFEKTRYNIRVAERRNLTVERYDADNITKEAMSIFCGIMKETAERDKFICRNNEYLTRLLKELSSNAIMYLVKYNIEKDMQDTRKKIDSLNEKLKEEIHNLDDLKSTGAKEKKIVSKERMINDIKRQISSNEKRVEEIKPYASKKSIYLSGSICGIFAGKGLYLYGASSDLFRNTMPNYLMQWNMIKDCINRGCHIYDLRGVPGNPDPKESIYGLYLFKKGFGGDYTEFIGEFDLPIDKFIYFAYKYGLPQYRKMRDRLFMKKLNK